MVANVIAERLSAAGVNPANIDIAPLARFLELMAKWNRHINLTALGVDQPTNEAVDRLIVEPVAAARQLGLTPVSVVDIGSGGGSPAIPFKLQFPTARLAMVESRSKKCAFLREAVRSLEMTRSQVIEARFEDVEAGRLQPRADLVTVRAVRLDLVSVNLIRALSLPEAVLVRFASAADDSDPLFDPDALGLRLVSERPLVSLTRSSIQLFHVEH
jgi:16S rRNA (guanine527-N7)-methyltransferase